MCLGLGNISVVFETELAVSLPKFYTILNSGRQSRLEILGQFHVQDLGDIKYRKLELTFCNHSVANEHFLHVRSILQGQFLYHVDTKKASTATYVLTRTELKP
jgi:hypothetical protein